MWNGARKWVDRCTSCKEGNTIKTIQYAKNIVLFLLLMKEAFGNSQTVCPSWLAESSPLLKINEINCVESIQSCISNCFSFEVKCGRVAINCNRM